MPHFPREIQQNRKNPYIDFWRSQQGVRSFHRGMLSQAITSLENVKVERRDITTGTFTVHMKDMPKMKEKIHKFRETLMTEFETDQGSEVFALNIQLIPLTKEKKGS